MNIYIGVGGKALNSREVLYMYKTMLGFMKLKTQLSLIERELKVRYKLKEQFDFLHLPATLL